MSSCTGLGSIADGILLGNLRVDFFTENLDDLSPGLIKLLISNNDKVILGIGFELEDWLDGKCFVCVSNNSGFA